jgi:hypothetical protein
MKDKNYSPCPFCGSILLTEQRRITWPNFLEVFCFGCGACASPQIWNKRAGEMELKKKLLGVSQANSSKIEQESTK